MMINTGALDFIDCIERYLAALGRSDFDNIVALFSPQAMVTSPFLGRMAARPFFDSVASASQSSTLGSPELFVSASASQRAIGYFHYDWVLKDGTRVNFPCVDIFEFTRDGRICDLTIVYDTEPVRRVVGDKYQAPKS